MVHAFCRPQSSSNTAWHGPLSYVEINSYGNLSKSKSKPEGPISYIKWDEKRIFSCIFYTGLKYKKLESERFCPCILSLGHIASRVFLSFAQFWRTQERLHESSRIFVEHALVARTYNSNPGLIGVFLRQRARLWPWVYQLTEARTWKTSLTRDNKID